MKTRIRDLTEEERREADRVFTMLMNENPNLINTIIQEKLKRRNRIVEETSISENNNLFKEGVKQ